MLLYYLNGFSFIVWAPVIGNNSPMWCRMDAAREGSEGLMSGNFESLPYERFSGYDYSSPHQTR